MLAVARNVLRLRRMQRSPRSRVDAARDRQLQQLVMHACGTVPYYRQRFADAGVDPASIRTVADLARIPPTTKADLQAAGIDAITSDAVPPAACITEKTSGSSGRPFEMRLDRRWIAVRNAMFLRALSATGYRLHERLLLVSGGPLRRGRWPMQWRYVPFELTATDLVAHINAFRPHVLYGWVTPLRQLAEHVGADGGLLHRPRAIVTTAEAVDAPTRRLLADALGGDVFQIYGLTEMGAMAWECTAHRGMHLAEDVIVTEQVEGRLVLTNLALYSMPLIRYDSGDLAPPIARVTGDAPACRCGCRYDVVAHVEGRLVDSVVLPDGRRVSPYQLTLAMEKVPTLRRYQITQRADNELVVGYVQGGETGEDVDARIRAVLSPVVGGDVQIRSQRCDTLDPPPGRKFRVVERRLGEERLPA